MVLVVLVVLVLGFIVVLIEMGKLSNQVTAQLDAHLQILKDEVLGTLQFRKIQLKKLDDEAGNIPRRLDRLSKRISETRTDLCI